MYHNAIFFLSLFIDVICDKRRTKITSSQDTHLHFKIQEPISHMLLHATINVCFTLFTHSHIHTFSIPFHLNNYIFKCNPLGTKILLSTILKSERISSLYTHLLRRLFSEGVKILPLTLQVLSLPTSSWVGCKQQASGRGQPLTSHLTANYCKYIYF